MEAFCGSHQTLRGWAKHCRPWETTASKLHGEERRAIGSMVVRCKGSKAEVDLSSSPQATSGLVGSAAGPSCGASGSNVTTARESCGG